MNKSAPPSPFSGLPLHSGETDRAFWVEVAERLARPVLQALSEQKLKAVLPIESHSASKDRATVTHLEAVGRLLAGIAPWLELGADTTDEGKLRGELIELARRGIAHAVDPASPDYLNFATGMQPVVDMGFLAQAILRSPTELSEKLPTQTQNQLADALQTTRTRKPLWSNWLLFSATVEAALYKMGRDYDRMRVDYALRQHEQWYVGDGAYSDGPAFHWDYYNSFVIQPMLVDIARAFAPEPTWATWREPVEKRAQRYAAVLERGISPEGTFPVWGRSLAYRFGALQSLGQAALLDFLPIDISPAQTRSAMTAVIARMMSAPGTFDANGFLRIGFCGAQPQIGETYISTGSLYLCAVGLLPLGLPVAHEFWTAPGEDWTARKLWGGLDLPADKALKD